MEYSLPAWLGALVGTVVAVLIYVPAIRVVERSFRAKAGPQTLEQRAAFAEKFSIARRLILAVDIAILATVGYWIGHAIGGSRF
jgi:ABC-type uncharacterized transport system permease subunit